MDFFKEFETERRSVGATLSDLQTRLVEFSVDSGTPIDELGLPRISDDMLSYYLAFAREGASKENIATRSAVMYRRLLLNL